MFWKLLLTAAVVLGGYLLIRARMRDPRATRPVTPGRGSALPRGLVRTLAYALIGLSLGGVVLYLVRSWEEDRTILRVQVVNANTGMVTDYLARRRDIEGRGFRTLEGQVIRLADVERMVLMSADPETRP